MKTSKQFIGHSRPVSSSSAGSKEIPEITNSKQVSKSHEEKLHFSRRPKRCADPNRKPPCRGRGHYGKRDILEAYKNEISDSSTSFQSTEQTSGFMPKLIYTSDQKIAEGLEEDTEAIVEMTDDDIDLNERVLPREEEADSPGMTPVLLKRHIQLPYKKFYRNSNSVVSSEQNEDTEVDGCSPFQYFHDTMHSGLYNIGSSTCLRGPFYLPFGAESQLDVKGDNAHDFIEATEHFPNYNFLKSGEIIKPEKKVTCWQKDYKDLDELLAEDELKKRFEEAFEEETAVDDELVIIEFGPEKEANLEEEEEEGEFEDENEFDEEDEVYYYELAVDEELLEEDELYFDEVLPTTNVDALLLADEGEVETGAGTNAHTSEVASRSGANETVPQSADTEADEQKSQSTPQSQATISGAQTQAGNSGSQSQAANSRPQSQAGNSGPQSQAGNSRPQSQASNSRPQSQAGSSKQGAGDSAN